jgi:undecaprenyl-diphosphatase
MQFFSMVGSPAVLSALSVTVLLIFWRAGWVRAGFLFAIALAGGVLLDQVLKLSFQRVRPAPYFNYPAPESFSFPSGHALVSFCFFGMMASLVNARLRSGLLRMLIWISAAVLIALIGFSRIYLGVHYPTDVIGGYIAAFIWVAMVTLGDRWHRGRGRRQIQ